MTLPARKRRPLRANAIAFALLVRDLQDGTATITELAIATGLAASTVSGYVRAMHKHGAAHIVAWADDALGRAALPVFKLGYGKDAARQKRTGADRAKAYRTRLAQARLIHTTTGSTWTPSKQHSKNADANTASSRTTPRSRKG